MSFRLSAHINCGRRTLKCSESLRIHRHIAAVTAIIMVTDTSKTFPFLYRRRLVVAILHFVCRYIWISMWCRRRSSMAITRQQQRNCQCFLLCVFVALAFCAAPPPTSKYEQSNHRTRQQQKLINKTIVWGTRLTLGAMIAVQPKHATRACVVRKFVCVCVFCIVRTRRMISLTTSPSTPIAKNTKKSKHKRKQTFTLHALHNRQTKNDENNNSRQYQRHAKTRRRKTLKWYVVKWSEFASCGWQR